MRPENFKFGGGATDTVLHPLVLVAMLLGIVLVLVLPRKYAVIPLLCMAFLVPVGQQVVVGGVHLFIVRFVILAGLARLAFSRLGSRWGRIPGGFSAFDKLFLAWASFRALAFVLLFQQTSAVVNQAGFLLDSLGAFFLLRFLIQNDKDVQRVIKVMAAIAAVLAVSMTYEHFKGLNVFALLGGVPTVPEMRNSLYRAQGPFAHALLAGTFGATLLPLFVWLWVGRKSRVLAVVGVLASTIVTVDAACSTPIMAYAAGLGAICLWPLRRQMRPFRWGIVLVLIALHFVMKAPVWYLIAHIDVVGGSSSDHRAQLLNLFITRIRDWWLIGTDSNADWGWGMWDTANQYVAEGWTGGLATLLCFLAIIAIAFQRIGVAHKSATGNRKREWYLWLLGATLFAHVTAFLGISYFDQTRVLWFTLLVMISVATIPVLTKETVPTDESADLSIAPPELAYFGPALRQALQKHAIHVSDELPACPRRIH